MNHKRGRPKNRRAGCLFCKPHKANGAKNRVLPRDARRTEPTRSTDSEQTDDEYLARIREEGKTIGGLMGLDRLAVARLNRLIREADDAKVVISSSWRHGRTRPQLARLLADAGFVGSVIGMTPDFVHVHEEAGVVIGKQRGDEIQAWLDVAPRFGHDVDSFVILDDGSDMAHLKDRLVKTEFSMGLLEEHVDRAIRMLCAAPPLVVLAEAIP